MWLKFGSANETKEELREKLTHHVLSLDFEDWIYFPIDI